MRGTLAASVAAGRGCGMAREVRPVEER
jgi:hypothetical protein